MRRAVQRDEGCIQGASKGLRPSLAALTDTVLDIIYIEQGDVLVI